jgi:hypothetical protein
MQIIGQHHDRVDRERVPGARVAKRRPQQADMLGENRR